MMQMGLFHLFLLFLFHSLQLSLLLLFSPSEGFNAFTPAGAAVATAILEIMAELHFVLKLCASLLTWWRILSITLPTSSILSHPEFQPPHSLVEVNQAIKA